MVGLGVRDCASRQLDCHVLLVAELKDVLLLGAVRSHILFAELLAVGIEAIVHRSDQSQPGCREILRINTRGVVLLHGDNILTDSIHIIHLFVQNVKSFYQ